MIFDTEEMANLRAKFIDKPDYLVPKIVLLDRLDVFDEERKLLEEIVSKIDPENRRTLLNRLINEENAQHLGAWFEIRLLEWLNDFSKTAYEPEIEGANPDYLVKVNGETIVIEARAVQLIQEKRKNYQIDSILFDALRSIEREFLIVIKDHSLSEIPTSTVEFVNAVIQWLDTTPSKILTYNFPNGSVVLEAQPSTGFEHVASIGPSRFSIVSSERLKNPISKKAKQHKSIRDAEYPYVPAFLVEDIMIAADEFVRALFGDEQITFRQSNGEIVGRKFNKKGINFHRGDVQHTSVSGILVFKLYHTDNGFRLHSTYIENPFASVPIDPNVFPVDQRFVEMERDENGIQMGWEKGENL